MTTAYAQSTAPEAPATRAYDPPSFNDGPVRPSLMAVSADTPPADVVGTASALALSCAQWNPGQVAATSDGLRPSDSLVLHTDVCQLVTNPKAFYSKTTEAFGTGVVVTIGAIVACMAALWVIKKSFRFLRGLLDAWKADRAEQAAQRERDSGVLVLDGEARERQHPAE